MDELRHSVAIAAPPEVVYDLLADVTRMPEWSPECTSCRWLGGAHDARVGARYRGRSRNGWHRWSTIATIVAADRGSRLTWDVSYFGQPVAQWSYQLEAEDPATTLSESVIDKRGRLLRTVSPFVTGSRDRRQRNDETMRTTLERIKQAVER